MLPGADKRIHERRDACWKYGKKSIVNYVDEHESCNPLIHVDLAIPVEKINMSVIIVHAGGGNILLRQYV